MAKNNVIKKEGFGIRLVIYLIIGIFVIYSGYLLFFNNINDAEKKFEFVWKFALLGIIIGALITSLKNNDLKKWEDKEFMLYGFLAFFGSLLTIIFLGLQGFNYLDLPTQTTNNFVDLGNILASLGVIIILASVIGLSILSWIKIWRIYNG